MKISIVSKDKRFVFVKENLRREGYECNICDIDDYCDSQMLVLSPRLELCEDDLRVLFSKVNNDTTVLSGQKHKIEEYFDGKVFDYSDNETFLFENAYITAQCALKLTLENIDTLVYGKRAFVVGYGRIGKYLASMLRALGAVVFVYARRREITLDASYNGCIPASLDDIKAVSPDIIYNTVPGVIIKNEYLSSLASDPILYELASSPGGFESTDGVISASGLPGRMMPKSAAKAISDLVLCILQGKDRL